MIEKLFGKLFLSRYYFTIALRHRAQESILENTQFQSESMLPATLSDWVADPILVDDGEKTYMFYEAVRGQKGRLEVVEIYDDCSVSDPVVILESEHHYSYPFVFRRKDRWFMIPESSTEREVALYRAVEFPWKWEKDCVLLSDLRAVDTTVFSWKGSDYLLTYLPSGVTEHVTPRAYRLDLFGDSVLTEISWTEFDPLEVRGAGPVFEAGGRLYRPAQINEADRYGNAVVFYEIATVSPVYCEVQKKRLMPVQLTVPSVICDGLHTYATSERFEAIDIRCRKVDFLKVFRKMLQKIVKS